MIIFMEPVSKLNAQLALEISCVFEMFPWSCPVVWRQCFSLTNMGTGLVMEMKSDMQQKRTGTN